jgi:hypothetical protein
LSSFLEAAEKTKTDLEIGLSGIDVFSKSGKNFYAERRGAEGFESLCPF